MGVSSSTAQLPQVLHVVVLGVVEEDAIVGRLTFVATDVFGLEFLLEIGEVFYGFLGGRGGGRDGGRGARWDVINTRSGDRMQHAVVGIGVVDERVGLRPVEELVFGGCLFVAGDLGF